MPEYHSDSLIPVKHGVLSPFAQLVWGMALLIVLSLALLFWIQFDFQRLRGADYFISKAQQAVLAKDWPAAVGAIQQVQQHAREKPTHLRVLADLLEATNSEHALLDSTLKKLDDQGSMLPVDYLWACRLRLVAGQIAAARQAWERIPSTTRSGLEARKLNLAILREDGHPQEAAAEENRLQEEFPDDPEIALRKAVQDLTGTFPEIQQAARRKLWELAQHSNEAEAAAIRVLSQRNDLTQSEATQLLELADQQPTISPTERLRLVSLILRLDPTQREALLNAETQRYRTAGPAELAQVASWLAHEKEYGRLMTILPEDLLMKSPDLFPQVAQGLASQEKWQDLLTLVKKGKKLPVSNARAATWRALAARHLRPDDTRELREHLEEAVRVGSGEKNALAVLGAARLAEEWGVADLALKAYEELAVPGSPQEEDMLEKCWQMATILKDTTALLRLADKLATLRPANVQFVQRRDYLRLLCGDKLETTLLRAAADTAQPTRASDIDFLLQALKAHRLHERDRAAAALEQILDTTNLTVGERAVYAGLLALNGQARRAYILAETIRSELLLPEETVFLRQAL